MLPVSYLGILNRKNLDAVNNTRIQHLLAKLLGYTFKVKWVPGKNHVIADALSRAPVFAAEGHDDIIIRKVADVVPDPALTELAERAKLEEDYQRVVVAVREKAVVKDLNKRHPAQRYRAHWDAMAVEGSYELLTYHNRILVPKAARPNILHIAHTTYGQGEDANECPSVIFLARHVQRHKENGIKVREMYVVPAVSVSGTPNRDDSVPSF
jgi:hypothetical protein